MFNAEDSSSMRWYLWKGGHYPLEIVFLARFHRDCPHVLEKCY